jgi:hypothetical protein
MVAISAVKLVEKTRSQQAIGGYMSTNQMRLINPAAFQQ